MLVDFICWLLKRPLTSRDRTKLTNQILSTVGGLPLHAIITEDDGRILVKGVPLDGELAVKIRESASQAIHNKALEVVHEQALYLAVSKGLHESQNFDQVSFAKAAVWFAQQERNLLHALAREGSRELDLSQD